MKRSQSAFEQSSSAEQPSYDIPSVPRSVSHDNVNDDDSGKCF